MLVSHKFTFSALLIYLFIELSGHFLQRGGGLVKMWTQAKGSHNLCFSATKIRINGVNKHTHVHQLKHTTALYAPVVENLDRIKH